MGDSVRPTMLMLGLSHLRLFLLGTATVLVSAAPMTSSCKPVEPAADFRLDAYLGKWFIQQQMETKYLPKGRNYCVVAEYSRKSKSLFGWDLNVHNRDQDADGTVHDSTKDTKGAGLCAKVVNATNGKLEVAPCFLPPALSGPYWVIQATQGWALVVGGQPTIPTTAGLCKTGDGVNNAGLWIFSRQQTRNETQITLARNIATENGIDVSVLNDIDQTNCTVAE